MSTRERTPAEIEACDNLAEAARRLCRAQDEAREQPTQYELVSELIALCGRLCQTLSYRDAMVRRLGDGLPERIRDALDEYTNATLELIRKSSTLRSQIQSKILDEFVRLVSAHFQEDSTTIAEAREELRRLGLTKWPRREEGPPDAHDRGWLRLFAETLDATLWVENV